MFIKPYGDTLSATAIQLSFPDPKCGGKEATEMIGEALKDK